MGKQKNIIMLDQETLLKNLKESWRYIDQIQIGKNFKINAQVVEYEENAESPIKPIKFSQFVNC